MEMRIKPRRSNSFFPRSHVLVLAKAVLRDRDVYKSHVEMYVCVVFVLFSEALGCVFEPRYLIGFDPVIPAEFVLIRRV